MDPAFVSSVYYVSASLRQAALSLSDIVFDTNVTLSKVGMLSQKPFWDFALVTQGTRGLSEG